MIGAPRDDAATVRRLRGELLRRLDAMPMERWPAPLLAAVIDVANPPPTEPARGGRRLAAVK